MYISLWVLIPAVLIFIAVAREGWSNGNQLSQLKSDSVHDKQMIKSYSEEVRELRHTVGRADYALGHLRFEALDEGTDKMRAATEEAIAFFEEEGKTWMDAPWRFRE